jgi:DNA replication protein DnaC
MVATVHNLLPPTVRTAEEIKYRSYLEELTGLQGRLLDSSLDDFKATTPKQKHALQACRRYVEAFDEQTQQGRGLVFVGPCGTAKSTLAAGVTLGVSASCYEVLFTTVPRLLRRLHQFVGRRRKPSDDEDELVTLDEVIEHYGKFLHLLVLDEITAETGTATDLALLDEVINLRSLFRRPTLVTSNLTPTELRVTLGDRMFDRLLEGAQTLVLDGPSLRTGME